MFVGGKKARWCPACRRERANVRTKSFLAANPGYVRRKMAEYRARRLKGVMKQPLKSYALRQAKQIASAMRQGWKLEMRVKNGRWSWKAQKGGCELASAADFDSFAQARKDFLEAVF